MSTPDERDHWAVNPWAHWGVPLGGNKSPLLGRFSSDRRTCVKFTVSICAEKRQQPNLSFIMFHFQHCSSSVIFIYFSIIFWSTPCFIFFAATLLSSVQSVRQLQQLSSRPQVGFQQSILKGSTAAWILVDGFPRSANSRVVFGYLSFLYSYSYHNYSSFWTQKNTGYGVVRLQSSQLVPPGHRGGGTVWGGVVIPAHI